MLSNGETGELTNLSALFSVFLLLFDAFKPDYSPLIGH